LFDPVHLILAVPQVVLEKVEHGLQLGLGKMTVRLGDFDQDIDEQIDKSVMGFGLGCFVRAYAAPDIITECPEGSEYYKEPDKTDEKEETEKIQQRRGTARCQDDEAGNQQASAATGLIMLSVLHVISKKCNGKIPQIFPKTTEKS
jgi:hypothetical protein